MHSPLSSERLHMMLTKCTVMWHCTAVCSVVSMGLQVISERAAISRMVGTLYRRQEC